MNKNENLLNKYRLEVFGIAVLGILLVHSISIINYPTIIKKIVGYGGLGVYMFVFLSGIGLYFSLKKNEKYNKFNFYSRRFLRTGLPYILIAGLWYGVKYLFIQHDFVYFFYELSTVSFWAEHKGAWYVAMLIPLYLIYPWYHDWLEKGNRNIKFVIIIILWIFLIITIRFYNPALYEHLAQVLSSVLIFLVGNYIAAKFKNSKHVILRVFVLSVMLFIVKTLFSDVFNGVVITNVATAFLGVTLTISTAWLLDKIKNNFINSSLKFLGKNSLEIYLTNIFLLQIYQYFQLDTILESYKYGAVFAYLIIVIVGIFSSLIFGVLSTKIAKKIF